MSQTITFPDSLRAPDARAGRELAVRITSHLLPATASAAAMPELLRTGGAGVSREIVEAIYFHAISVANNGWR